MLHLMARILVPLNEDFGGRNDYRADKGAFVPLHLRIATIAETPVFFEGTLYENLIFGLSANGAIESSILLERVVKICRMLNVDEEVFQYLDTEEDWEAAISETNLKLLSIARALINNAEVICFHKPTSIMEAEQKIRLLQVLHKHIEGKGLVLAEDAYLRRPRTVFLSAARIGTVLACHSIYHVSRHEGISRLAYNEALALHKAGKDHL